MSKETTVALQQTTNATSVASVDRDGKVYHVVFSALDGCVFVCLEVEKENPAADLVAVVRRVPVISTKVDSGSTFSTFSDLLYKKNKAYLPSPEDRPLFYRQIWDGIRPRPRK